MRMVPRVALVHFHIVLGRPYLWDDFLSLLLDKSISQRSYIFRLLICSLCFRGFCLSGLVVHIQVAVREHLGGCLQLSSFGLGFVLDPLALFIVLSPSSVRLFRIAFLLSITTNEC